MPEWSAFQTETGELVKYDRSFDGDEEVIKSYPCRVDPVFGFKSSFTADGEKITGKTTTLDGLPNIDLSHKKWRLEYNGNSYLVNDLVPYPAIGSNDPESYQVILT